MTLGIKAWLVAGISAGLLVAVGAQESSTSLEDLLLDLEPASTTAAPTEVVEGLPAVLPEDVEPAPALETEAPSVLEEPAEVPSAGPEVESAPLGEMAPEMPAAEPVPEALPAEAPLAEEPATEAPTLMEEAPPAEELPAEAPGVEEGLAPVEPPVTEEVLPPTEPGVTPAEAPAAVEEPAPTIWEETPVAPTEPTILSEPTAIWEGKEGALPTAPEAALAPEAEAAEVEALIPPTPAPEAAEPEVAEPPPKKKISAKEARRIAEQEEVKRQALQLEGERQLQAGFTAWQTRDYLGAAKAFEEALAKLPDRPQNAELLERARWGLADAYYQIAAVQLREDNVKGARENAERALRVVPDHRPAGALIKRIEKIEELAALPKPPAKRPETIERVKTVSELLVEARQYFDLEDYNRAEKLYERVLLRDEYNVEAMRYLRKIDERRFKRRTTQRDATVANMMQQVRDAWTPPVREEVEAPERVPGRETMVDKTAQQKLQEKLSSIIIPSLEFRQANIHDVIKFLVDASIAGDPAGVGVNILLNLNVPGAEGAAMAPAPAPEPAVAPQAGFEEFDAFFQEQAAAAPVAAAAPGIRTITLNLRRVSLLDAIKYITEVANLKFRIEDNVVIITPAGVVTGRVITRMYPVQPSILDVIVEKEEAAPERTGEFIAMGGGRQTVKRGDVKEFFERAGVPFPAGTSITYNPTISQLIVANTAENLDTFERILAQLNVIPTQVEIEARFVEVNQSDLEELGLQWLLTDNYEIAQRQGIAPVTGRERVQINADSQGFTKGLRFFAFDRTTGAIDPVSTVSRSANQSTLGGILTAASVLTNPEVTMILQALSQSGHSDLLSAPRITTRSGVNAQIQVVREIIYPTEFEVTQPTVQSQGDLVTPPTVTPGTFQTRQVGVILNVTPTVGPDGYTIDLTMTPEVAELVDWIQYGSEITLETGTAEARQQRSFRYNIPQPIFSSRNVTTSLVIWDGQTVVMGGLIREEMVTIKDKIPFLGDIPILGRLFRSEGQKSKKTNLLIFVTARLVDPAGKPLHRADVRPMTGGGVTAGEGAVATP